MNEARRLEDEGSVRIPTWDEVREVYGDGHIEAVTIENTSTWGRPSATTAPR